MLTSAQAKHAADSDVDWIVKHVQNDFKHNEDFRDLDFSSTPVFHYVVSGSHIDPDLGREYVPLNEPVNSYRRRKVVKRNKKVQELVASLMNSLNAGHPVHRVQEDLSNAQPHPAVHLAASANELRRILAAVFEADECAPGCLDGGYYDLVGGNAVIYGWEEALPCEAGVHDRYSEAEMIRRGGK